MAAIFATVTSTALGVLALRRANAVASADNVKRCVSGAKTSATGAFGEAIRPELHLDFTHTQLNHGSFGVCPRVVLAKVLEEELRLEAFPDSYFRRYGLPMYRAACDTVGKFLGVPGKDVVVLSNATFAVNSVLATLDLKPGDAVLMASSTYNACKLAVRAFCEPKGAEVVVVPIDYGTPGSTKSFEDFNAGVLSNFAQALAGHPSIKFALIDHISSMPSAIFPAKELTELLHSKGVQVMIDGAHAPGQIAGLCPADIGAEWYTGNMHKWAYAAKGVAFMYAAPHVQASLKPVIVSHFYHDQDLQKRFHYYGTTSQSAWISVGSGLQFAAKHGGFAVMNTYSHELGVWACDTLSAQWGTEPLQDYRLCGNLFMLRTPLKWEWFVGPGKTQGDAEADPDFNERVASALYAMSGIQGQFMLYKGAVYTRISSQVYLTKADFAKFGVAVLALCKDVQVHSRKAA